MKKKINMNKILKRIKWDKLVLVIFCLLVLVFLFKVFLIPMVLSMVKILLKLVDLYKLLEMPYLFFGSALFLFMVWYIFNAICNIAYQLFKFTMTTSKYDSQNRSNAQKKQNGK